MNFDSALKKNDTPNEPTTTTTMPEAPELKYDVWLKSVRQLVTNQLDATTYEVQTMKLLGPQSYELFGIDDLILQARRQVSIRI